MNKIKLLLIFSFISIFLPLKAQILFMTPNQYPDSPIKNFMKVAPNVYRGAQPIYKKDFKFLRERAKVDTIVNLNWPVMDHPIYCAKFNLNCYFGPDAIFPNADIFFDWKTFFKDYSYSVKELKEGKTVYVHCHFGRERTGLIATALYLRYKACNKKKLTANEKKIIWDKINAVNQEIGYMAKYKSLQDAMYDWIHNFEKHQKWICE